MKTNCEHCTQEIDEDEVQMCSKCEKDGLGDCCVDNHDCEEER